MINFVQFSITVPINNDWQQILLLLFIAVPLDKDIVDFVTPSEDVIISDRKMSLICSVFL